MPTKDTPPEGYQFAPLPPVPDPRFVAPQGYAFADQGRPEPVPLRETNVAPVQIDPRSVQTDRDTALELTQLGLDIAGMMLLPGPKGLKVPGKGAKEFGLYLGKRGLWAAGVGGTTAGAKEVASRLMGYPPDPHLGTTIAVHSGLMAGFELGGGLVQNAPTAYRAFRVSTGGPAYMQRLTDKAAAKATQEDLYRFMQEMGLVPPVQGGAPAATSIGRISGRKGTKAIERFGEQTIGGAQFSNVDETLLGELRNSQVKILNDFGTMVSREEAGLNLQKVIAATDRGVDMAYSSGKSVV